jgi:hypothetical protein
MGRSCKEREDLWEAYNQSLTAFSKSVDELTSASDDVNFNAKATACQQANERCKAARAAWEAHLGTHLCDLS